VDAGLAQRAECGDEMTVAPVFDPVIHAPGRLQICGLLSGVDDAEFALIRDRIAVSDSVLSKHLKLLDEAGLSKTQNINERKTPYIMNVSEDPTLLGMLLYDLKEGQTNIGTKDADENHVKLNVLGIMTRHCAINNEGG